MMELYKNDIKMGRILVFLTASFLTCELIPKEIEIEIEKFSHVFNLQKHVLIVSLIMYVFVFVKCISTLLLRTIRTYVPLCL